MPIKCSVFMLLYLGSTTLTSTPLSLKTLGSEPTTSPKPPDFAKGAHSEETTRTLRGFVFSIIKPPIQNITLLLQ